MEQFRAESRVEIRPRQQGQLADPPDPQLFEQIEHAGRKPQGLQRHRIKGGPGLSRRNDRHRAALPLPLSAFPVPPSAFKIPGGGPGGADRVGQADADGDSAASERTQNPVGQDLFAAEEAGDAGHVGKQAVGLGRAVQADQGAEAMAPDAQPLEGLAIGQGIVGRQAPR